MVTEAFSCEQPAGAAARFIPFTEHHHHSSLRMFCCLLLCSQTRLTPIRFLSRFFSVEGPFLLQENCPHTHTHKRPSICASCTAPQVPFFEIAEPTRNQFFRPRTCFCRDAAILQFSATPLPLGFPTTTRHKMHCFIVCAGFKHIP